MTTRAELQAALRRAENMERSCQLGLAQPGNPCPEWDQRSLVLASWRAAHLRQQLADLERSDDDGQQQ